MLDVAACAAPPAIVDAARTPPPTTEVVAAANRAVPTIVVSAQDRKPWAVSRKKTSCVWRPVHLVRRRPVIKPPSAEDTHWTTIRPMPALMVKVVADAPEFGHAEIVVRPRPVPSDV